LLPNNRNRWKSSLLLALATGLCIAQIPSMNLTEDVKRVGAKVRCMCGVCRNSMGDCPMLGCHSAVPGREKIAKMQAEGASDDTIVASFVKEHGKQVLVDTPMEGFSALSWLVPPVFLALGLGMVYFWIRRNRQPAMAAGVPAVALDKFQQQADEELSKFDS
jgi:cytochrome c-type biogenesis protein CcmH/NrfF